MKAIGVIFFYFLSLFVIVSGASLVWHIPFFSSTSLGIADMAGGIYLMGIALSIFNERG